MFKKYIDVNKMIENLQELIRIPSVYSETQNIKKPFGNNTVKALKYILDLAESMGFKVKNIDNYCGYIEFGEGSELIGIIGHLDVVPEGENWTYPPFEARIVDNKIYGRGAIDDKGPVMASLYAMKAVMDYCNSNSISINKRVRLILGLNEERDWKCIEYYKAHEELPTISFSPDADFPCIYAEKGLLSPILSMDYSSFKNSNIVLTDINCNNNPLNVVPKYCSCNLYIKNTVDIDNVLNLIEDYCRQKELNIKAEVVNQNEIKIESFGVQAHAAHPGMGINAISQLLMLLDFVFENNSTKVPLLDLFTKYIGLDYNGKALNINFPDESGELTLNVGNISLENNKLKLGINLRVPINTEFELVEKAFTATCKGFEGVSCEFIGKKDPLYIPKNSYLVQTLCRIYNECTNSNAEPIAIGGATYARAFDNCISFGANLPEQKDMCHQTDEFISIDNLVLACNIYSKAIYELAGIEGRS